MPTFTLPQIGILVLVIVGLIVLMRLIQPKLSPAERYLLHEIQRKSPQVDNIRLYMWIKMIVHPVTQPSDLEYQERFLSDAEQMKVILEQMQSFGAAILYPLFGFEAMNWRLAPEQHDPLFERIAALLIIRRFPHTAEVIEDFVAKGPDALTRQFIEKNSNTFAPLDTIQQRYLHNLAAVLQIMVTTRRNEWWPGTNPAIQEWAESTLRRLAKACTDIDLSFLEKQSNSEPKAE
jgi:hypothetical protein